MNCQRCERSLEHRTVCPDCRVPVRPKALLAASVVSLMIGILSLSTGNVIHALVSGAIGFFLLRVSRLAIGMALVLSVLGLLLNGALILTGGGEALLTAEGLKQVDPRSVRIAAVGQALLHLTVLLALLRPESRWAYRLIGMESSALDQVIAREQRSGEAGGGIN